MGKEAEAFLIASLMLASLSLGIHSSPFALLYTPLKKYFTLTFPPKSFKFLLQNLSSLSGKSYPKIKVRES